MTLFPTEGYLQQGNVGNVGVESQSAKNNRMQDSTLHNVIEARQRIISRKNIIFKTKVTDKPYQDQQAILKVRPRNK